MTLIFTEGFDYQKSVSDLAMTFTNLSGFLALGTGRNGGQAALMSTVATGSYSLGAQSLNSSLTYITKKLAVPVGSGTLGFAVNDMNSGCWVQIVFRDTTTGTAYDQFVVALSFGSTLGAVQQGVYLSTATSNTTILTNPYIFYQTGTASNGQTYTYAAGTKSTFSVASIASIQCGAIQLGGWNYIEIQAAPDSSIGFSILVNGLLALTVEAPVLRKQFAAASFDTIMIGGMSQTTKTPTFAIDDIYFCDRKGKAPLNDFIGPCHIATVRPTGPGSHTDFETFPLQTKNYVNVAETTYDADTSFNAGAVGQKDTFVSSASIASTAVVMAVNVKAAIRTDGTLAAGNVAPMIRSGTTDTTGTPITPTATYSMVSSVFPDDPASGGSWSPATANKTEIGYTITSS